MISVIEELKVRGFSTLAIGVIKVYRRTISAVTPPKCRYFPSCSQYGIEAIKEWGLIEGVALTRQRISRCKRPNGGLDLVPLASKAEKGNLSKEKLKYVDYQPISNKPRVELVSDYEHRFRLIFSYPLEQEFLSKDDFKRKIAEFNRYVLEIPSYSLLFKVVKVEVGEVGGYYLLRFAGTTSGEYLETQLDEVVHLLTAQLAGFLLAAQQSEFETLYFEIDGQVVTEPKPDERAVPTGYNRNSNLWTFTSNTSVWDAYWGDFVVYSLLDLLDVSLDTANIDLNPFDGDGIGCELDGCDGDGCDIDLNPFDGCDGCGA